MSDHSSAGELKPFYGGRHCVTDINEQTLELRIEPIPVSERKLGSTLSLETVEQRAYSNRLWCWYPVGRL